MQQMICAAACRIQFGSLRSHCKKLAGFTKGTVVRALYKPKHIASRENGLGLAKLFRHRDVMMETLYEHRSNVGKCERVLVRALFRYNGPIIFVGGNGATIRPGDIISAEFYLGKNLGEFCIEGCTQKVLPPRLLIHWRKKNGLGIITAKIKVS